jgi:predicted metal-dependent HD superfamily phosphohydrolase
MHTMSTGCRQDAASTETVMLWILATKSHALGEDDPDLKIFLDIDMSILGVDLEGELKHFSPAGVSHDRGDRAM